MNVREISENADKAPRNARFHVVPRYSGGSPAMVDISIAMTVADDEVHFYKFSLEGVYGEERKKLAESKGLSGIVYARWEKGRKVFRLDLITGLQIQEPKRLEYKDIQRLKLLINRKQFVGLDVDTQRELDALLFRASVHRQEIQ